MTEVRFIRIELFEYSFENFYSDDTHLSNISHLLVKDI